ncbi:MAG: hypothetical protein ACP5I1_09475, partial [Candidatus Hinthialibacter sp.]
IIPAGVLNQFKSPQTDKDGQGLQNDLDRLNGMRRSFLESVQQKSSDPVLASEIMGYFAPVELSAGVENIRSASQAFSVNIRAANPSLAPIRGRVSLDAPEGWSAFSHDAVAFDDRSEARRERRFLYTVNAPVDLWQNRYALDVILSGAWNDYPFRKVQTAYVGHQFIKRWMIVGPFSNERGEGFGTMNPPEINIQLQETYPGIEGEVAWSEHEFNDGYVDLNSVMTPNDNAVAYAYTSIYSPREHNCQFHVGCHGDLKLFLNYKEIYAKRNVGKNRPGGEIIIHPLYEGWNHLVVKLSERVGPWGFYFEIYDLLGKPIDGMQFALDKAE